MEERLRFDPHASVLIGMPFLPSTFLNYSQNDLAKLEANKLTEDFFSCLSTEGR